MLAAKLQEMPEHCPIHCFGSGRDHDAHTLNMIAQTGHGTFAFVEDENKVSDAFATCLGGMLSVFAQGLELTIIPDAKSTSGKVAAARTRYNVKSEKRQNVTQACVSIPDLFCGERRDILFELDVTAVRETASALGLASLLRLEASWTDPALRWVRRTLCWTWKETE
eukprot:g18872.t1